MSTSPRQFVCSIVIAATACAFAASAAFSQLPVAGLPVPELQIFDNVMQSYMQGEGINSGVLAVSVQGRVVYQRGFGAGVPENTPMRLASVEKPICSAAIQRLVIEGAISLDDFAFNLGQPGGGILNITPWNGIVDDRLLDITVRHLLNHQGGWDRDTAAIGDPQFKTMQIAQAMGIPSPAGPDDIIRYMLSQPLQYTPGMNACTTPQGAPFYCYSNFGYMVLGRIVEVVSGMPLLTYYRTRILTSSMWVPNGEILRGRTFAANQSPREPTYQCTNCSVTNVFNPGGPLVANPYGGWHQEAFMGHGNLVASPAPLLEFMDRYQVGVQIPAGTPLPPEPPGNFGGGSFNGALEGTSTCMRQRGDGINIVVLFTHWSGVNHAGLVANLISDIISTQGFDWPSLAADGWWLDFNYPPGSFLQVGSYTFPIRTMPQALGVGAGAKVRLKPGTSNWTGTISHRMQLDSPLGVATIGQ